MRLEHKLFALLAGLLALAAASINLQNYRHATRDIARNQRLDQRDKLAALAKVSKDAMVSGNDLALVDYARIVKPLNEFALWAAVVRDTGEVVAHTDPNEIGRTVEVPPAADPDKYLYAIPLDHEGKTLGWIRMAVDQAKLELAAEAARNTARRRALQVFGWAALLGLPLSFGLSRLLMRPLSRLLLAARAISGGDLQARAEVGASDELGELASQVNSMAEKLYGATGTGHEDSLKLAHDLKSPLAAIQSYLYLIEETPDSRDDVRKNIVAVRASAERLSRMVTEILEKEKVLDGKGEAALVALSLEETLQKVCLMQKVEAERKGLYFMDPGLPFGMPKVLAHPEHLHRVLDNLVANAIKYTPKDGSVWIEVEVKGAEVWVMVNDTGLGMDPDEVPAMFQRFERGHSPEVRNKQGVGLGLFIAKELVELMGGRIWIASRGKKQGSTVIFTLKAVFDEVTA